MMCTVCCIAQNVDTLAAVLNRPSALKSFRFLPESSCLGWSHFSSFRDANSVSYFLWFMYGYCFYAIDL